MEIFVINFFVQANHKKIAFTFDLGNFQLVESKED